jgi:hypothetical protein
MKTEPAKFVELEHKKRQQEILCRNIVQALMTKMHINSHESNLVFWVGTGLESNNFHALVHWATTQLISLQLQNENNASIIDQLEISLEKLVNAGIS